MVQIEGVHSKDIELEQISVWGHQQTQKKGIGYAGRCTKEHDGSASNGLLNLEKKLNLELNLILEQDEIMWFHKSRMKWIALEDRNTKFFHRTATVRRQRNKVTGLLDANNEWVFDEDAVKDMVLDFWSKLYTADRHVGMGLTMHRFPTVPTLDMEMVIRSIVLEDIRAALFDMDPNKAPGIDGYPASFFQKGWDIMKMDL